MVVTVFSVSTDNGAVENNQADSIPVYQKIQKSHEIIIGIAEYYPPLSFIANKKRIGIEIHIAEELSRFLNVKMTLKVLATKDYISAIQNKVVDILISGLSRNLKRAQLIWFSIPYLETMPSILIDKRILPQVSYGQEFEETPVKTLWDIKRLSEFIIAVKIGSVYEEMMKEEFSDKKSHRVQTNQEGIMALRDGKVQGFIQDSLFLDYLYTHDASLKSSYVLLPGSGKAEKI